ncbi:hypothetical protein FPV67DRAFT_182281 [Lyophyllum atratum]|nr:hypothetical protein FPV67DRAFT_182281 [Lyophyllum atratum]
MAFTAALFLYALHSIYSLTVIWNSFWTRLAWTPQPSLHVSRRRIPQHLAIILVTDPSSKDPASGHCLVESVRNAVGWCRAAGIDKLTVYEEHGMILKCSQRIRDIFCPDSDESTSELDIEYPLTPPPSDYADSRPSSPQLDTHTVTIHISNNRVERETPSINPNLKKSSVEKTSAKQLILCLASRQSSKPAIACIAESLVPRGDRKLQQDAHDPEMETFTLTDHALDTCLESVDGLSSPDAMIIHYTDPLHRDRTPLELHGYPPWHIRLTEIYCDKSQHPSIVAKFWTSRYALRSLEEATFNHALDDFSMAEMRFGR